MVESKPIQSDEHLLYNHTHSLLPKRTLCRYFYYVRVYRSQPCLSLF